MGNKIKYNLKNVHAAILKETTTDGKTIYSYDTPKAIPGAVSLSLDAEGDSSPFYADGIVYFRSVARITTDIPETSSLLLFPSGSVRRSCGEKLDANGVLIEENTHTDNVKFALLFEFDGDAKCIRHVMYNCTCARPSIASETKEDKIEPGTEKLSIAADPRADGLVKARTGDSTSDATYENWYKSVYTPTSEAVKTSATTTTATTSGG